MHACRPGAASWRCPLAPLPAAADEFTDTLESALKAYNEGDVAGAREDLDYAGKLLTALKAEALAKFLPAAPARLDAGGGLGRGRGAAGGLMGMFGGGTTAAATYTQRRRRSPSRWSRIRRWSTGSAR